MMYSVDDTIEHKSIEGHGDAWSAFRACVILNAHELHNGRVWRYCVSPEVEPIPFEALSLPDWAWRALNKIIASNF